MDRALLAHLSDETLAAVIHDLNRARGDLRFRVDRRPNDSLLEEFSAVRRAFLAAKTERTARRTLDKDLRRALALDQPDEDDRASAGGAAAREVAP